MRDTKPIPVTYGECAEYQRGAKIGLSGLVFFAALLAVCFFIWIVT